MLTFLTFFSIPYLPHTVSLDATHTTTELFVCPSCHDRTGLCSVCEYCLRFVIHFMAFFLSASTTRHAYRVRSTFCRVLPPIRCSCELYAYVHRPSFLTSLYYVISPSCGGTIAHFFVAGCNRVSTVRQQLRVLSFRFDAHGMTYLAIRRAFCWCSEVACRLGTKDLPHKPLCSSEVMRLTDD